jgi:hypothetical protein
MRLSMNREALEKVPAPNDAARGELAAVETVLAQRERMSLVAVRLAPPAIARARA